MEGKSKSVHLPICYHLIGQRLKVFATKKIGTPPCCHYFDRWCSLLLKCTSSKTKSLCTPRSLASILPLSETAFTFSPQFCIEEDSAHITSIPRCMSVKMLLENFLRLELFLRQSRMFPVCLFLDNRNM